MPDLPFFSLLNTIRPQLYLTHTLFKHFQEYKSPALHAHSKQLFKGHLYDACTKTSSDIVLIKIMTSAGVEIRIAFMICYLESLYEIEMGHYFCPKFVGHVTNQNILVDAGKLM